MRIEQTAAQLDLPGPVSRGAYTNTGPRVRRRSQGERWKSGNAKTFRPEHPDCEGTSIRQLAGLPAQGFSTDCLPIQSIADRTVALASIDGPRIWDQPITAARPRRNWRETLSSPHFPFHPTHDLGQSTICTTGARYTKSTHLTTSGNSNPSSAHYVAPDISTRVPDWRARETATCSRSQPGQLGPG
jgi:hypothetical protein